MNIQYYVLTHGDFGTHLIKSAELIAGTIENIKSISLQKQMSIADFIELAEQSIDVEAKSVVLLTDLFGGTPNNVAMYLHQKYDYTVVSGVNLPMVLEFALTQVQSKDDLVPFIQKVVESSQQGIKLLT